MSCAEGKTGFVYAGKAEWTVTEKDITGLQRKLENADFLAKTPEDVVAEQRARLADEQAKRQRFVDAIASLA